MGDAGASLLEGVSKMIMGITIENASDCLKEVVATPSFDAYPLGAAAVVLSQLQRLDDCDQLCATFVHALVDAGVSVSVIIGFFHLWARSRCGPDSVKVQLALLERLAELLGSWFSENPGNKDVQQMLVTLYDYADSDSVRGRVHVLWNAIVRRRGASRRVVPVDDPALPELSRAVLRLAGGSATGADMDLVRRSMSSARPVAPVNRVRALDVIELLDDFVDEVAPHVLLTGFFVRPDVFAEPAARLVGEDVIRTARMLVDGAQFEIGPPAAPPFQLDEDRGPPLSEGWVPVEPQTPPALPSLPPVPRIPKIDFRPTGGTVPETLP